MPIVRGQPRGYHQYFVPKTPSNGDVGTAIGLNHSTVSRIRSGARIPSVARMRAIEKAYNFPMVDQFAAVVAGNYAEEFEKAINA